MLDSLGGFLGTVERYRKTGLRCALFVVVVVVVVEGDEDEDEDDVVGRGKKDLLVVFISLPRR